MLELQNISFSYENKQIFRDFSLKLENGEILAVMGPSGCGKTTLLSLVAGILRPQKGFIISDIEQISYVFQEPRLLPWCTVKENLTAVLKGKEADDLLINAVLTQVDMPDCKDLYPDALSGGMKSRVALARAMIYGGDLFLLDEPFAALDAELRADLSDMLRRYLKEKGASAILVTHQIQDAERLADRILRL